MLRGLLQRKNVVVGVVCCKSAQHVQAEFDRRPAVSAPRRENISVAVRVRPAADDTTQEAWALDKEAASVAVHPAVAELPSMRRCVLEEQSHRAQRSYDVLFDNAASTRQVYTQTAQRVVLGALDGVNGAVLAYGQTASGKTYTMLGDHVAAGVVTMALVDVLTEVTRLSLIHI